MRILLTNDDGINAEGILMLAKALLETGKHEIMISAPSSQRSGASHSISLDKILKAKRVEIPSLPGVIAYAVYGTPADCVILGVNNLFDKPDIVISGINHGANIGVDTLYSGTIGAAWEACLNGIPALALSSCNHDPIYMSAAVQCGLDALDYYMSDYETSGKPICPFLSVNVPDIPLDEIQGVKLTPLCRTNVFGKYEFDGDCTYQKPAWSMYNHADDEDSDERWICEGYVTYTPLVCEILDGITLAKLIEKK